MADETLVTRYQGEGLEAANFNDVFRYDEFVDIRVETVKRRNNNNAAPVAALKVQTHCAFSPSRSCSYPALFGFAYRPHQTLELAPADRVKAILKLSIDSLCPLFSLSTNPPEAVGYKRMCQWLFPSRSVTLRWFTREWIQSNGSAYASFRPRQPRTYNP